MNYRLFAVLSGALLPITLLGWLAAGRIFATVAPAPRPPALIAHRCGTADAPENTLAACRSALANGVRQLWVSVQVTRDGVAVLYRPRELSALTDGQGLIAGYSFEELKRLNAGWQFDRAGADGKVTHPYRDKPVRIPSLEELLDELPADASLYLDIKTDRAKEAARAVAAALDRHDAWRKARIYSTVSANLQAFEAYPKARLFESRQRTRQRLVSIALEHRCDRPRDGTYLGFEWRRKVTLSETLTLQAEATSSADAVLWSRAAMACLNAAADVHAIVFGINREEDYLLAAGLGVDAVMVDSPRRAKAYRRDRRDLPRLVQSDQGLLDMDR